jgi:hypothetical protein
MALNIKFTSHQKTTFQPKDYIDDKALQVKHDQKLTISKVKLKWDELKEAVVSSLGKNANKKKLEELKEMFDKFKLITRTIISEDVDSDTISDAAYYLFQVFFYKNQENLSHDNLIHELNKTLVHIFPLCTKNLVEKTFSCIENIILNIQNKTIFDKIFKNDDFIGTGAQYGVNIDYIDPTDVYKNNMKYPFSTDIDSTIDETEDNEIKFDFPTTTSEAKAEENDQMFLKWISDVDKDVVKIVYDLLSSGKSNDELQNDLLECLGFEKFDLIGYLLNNRVSVSKSYKRVYVDMVKPLKTYASSAPMTKTSGQSDMASVLSSDIVVHTKSEKQIKKLIRKEEKKMNKFSKNNQAGDYDNVLCDDLNGLIDADQSVLRKIREEQLNEVRLLNIYNKNRELLGPRGQQQTKINYPFVFDRLLKATQTMAHIAGAKILLPENIVRVDSKQYEQIYIPAVNSDDDKERIELIDVATLDNIGKIAFRNVKFLNRIQSVVFQSAYTSNENLLICAPTG